VEVGAGRDACAYQRAKNYGYWKRADEHATLAPLPAAGCPFGGPYWQLWVNHTLAHVEASRRGAGRAAFLVCASTENDALLRKGAVLDGFRALLTSPRTAGMLGLDALIDRVATVAGEESAWAGGLRARYGRI
jgi:hypothetical protein